MDPTYAPSHAALSLTYLTASQTSLLSPKETFPNVSAAALKAVELDDTLPDAHAALAEASLGTEWDRVCDGPRDTPRALERNPDSDRRASGITDVFDAGAWQVRGGEPHIAAHRDARSAQPVCACSPSGWRSIHVVTMNRFDMRRRFATSRPTTSWRRTSLPRTMPSKSRNGRTSRRNAGESSSGCRVRTWCDPWLNAPGPTPTGWADRSRPPAAAAARAATPGNLADLRVDESGLQRARGRRPRDGVAA